MALVDHWPLFGLRVRTPRLELRCPTDEIGGALGELAVGGIHDPATMPFSFPWTDAPPAELPRAIRREDIELSGLEPCLALLVGTDSGPEAGASSRTANPGS